MDLSRKTGCFWVSVPSHTAVMVRIEPQLQTARHGARIFAMMASSKVVWSPGITQPKSPAAGASDAVVTRASRGKIQEGRSTPWAALWLDTVAFWNDRIDLRPWVPRRALENDPVSYRIPVTILPWGGILDRRHLGDAEHHCASVRGACNLLNYIVNRIPVAQDTAFVNVRPIKTTSATIGG
jgi:hypothetical protein